MYRERLIDNYIIVHPSYLACVKRKVNRQIIVHSGFPACVHRKINQQIIEHSGFLASVADPEGVQGVRSNPPFGLNYFIFMGNFRKNEAKLEKPTPLSEFEPPIKKSWIRSWACVHRKINRKIIVHSGFLACVH